MTPKLKILLITLASAVSLDQATKAWVSNRIPVGAPSESIPVIDGFFYITHARNPGAMFGLLIDWAWEWRLAVFVVVAVLAIIVILSFYRGLAPGERFNSMALGLIMAGSIGNLIDRVLRGEVVDFLHFRLSDRLVWPDFNVADSCIVVGVTALIVELLASEGASRAAGEGQSGASTRDDGAA